MKKDVGKRGVLLSIKIDILGAWSMEEALNALRTADGKNYVIPVSDVKASGIVWRS